MTKTPPKPTILFATLAAGGGHVSTAPAIDRGYPGRFELLVSDLMLDLGFSGLDARPNGYIVNYLQSGPPSARLRNRQLSWTGPLT